MALPCGVRRVADQPDERYGFGIMMTDERKKRVKMAAGGTIGAVVGAKIGAGIGIAGAFGAIAGTLPAL